MIINIDMQQFESLLQYIQDQTVIYNKKHIIFNINGAPCYNSITVEVKKY